MMHRIDEILRRGWPDTPAVIDRGIEHSYADLDAAADADAARLQALGLERGGRVAVYAPKSILTLGAMFGVWRAGGVLVPINPALKPAQVQHILADSGARFLMSSAPRIDQLAQAHALGRTHGLLLGDRPLAHFVPAPRGAQDLAAILYTSGSTGRPKGVMLSHRNLLLSAESVATYLQLTPDDRSLAVLPLSFDAGLSVVTSALLARGSVTLLDYLFARDVVRTIADTGVTTLSGVPPLFVQLAEFDWPEPARASLNRLTVTGGRMPSTLTTHFRALLPDARIYLMYGLTEAFRSLYLDPDEVDLRPDSVGKAIPHAEVLIVRPDGTLADDDEPGELVHCGPLVAMGYWNDPGRTAERFRPAPPLARHQGPAVWSGDTLRRDAQGFHYFVGRADEMIKTSGFRVSPTEIEEAAVASGAVAEAVALGVADPRLGQAILLVARAPEGVAVDDAANRLKDALARTLPNFMMPARIVWRDSLPRNANGKLDRVALRLEYSQ